MIIKEEFFPTPKEIIRTMIRPYNNLSDLTILEPSAGRGDILDYIKGRYDSYHRSDQPKMYCCEIDKDLQYQLQEKGHRIISEDFLHYYGDYYFDLILMNPPFSNGDEHLLKAWDILIEGDIVCLLNAETINNPFSERRQHLIKLIGKNGTIENLGQCFFTAERRTSVEVVLIRLHKKSNKNKFDFDLIDAKNEKHFDLNENIINNEIATLDIIGNMIIQYDKIKESYVNYLKAEEQLSFYSQGLFHDNKKATSFIPEEKSRNPKEKYNQFCDDSKDSIWRKVIDAMGMDRYMTNNVRENFSKFLKAQGAMDFTKENVRSLIKMLLLNGGTILDQAIVDVFDIFTRHHEENRYLIEGWKTNNKWKVNRKIILPYFVEGGFNGCYSTNGNRYNEYSDIERVMCYISGKKYEDFTTPTKEYPYNAKEYEKIFLRKSLKQAIQQTRYGDSSLQDSEFFTFRCYKKGTLHIEFKDEWLWKEFNLRACKGKKWLAE